MGSIYSRAFKTQSDFYHKLNSVANDCYFTNKNEIVKFLYLTHNQNTKVHEHLLKELTDTTSLADMLRMARVCEGTVHSEKISKQYLESVKTVKQVDTIHQQCNNNRSRSKRKGCGGHRSHSQSQSRKPGGNCSNCGTNHPPRKCKAYGKECFHCHKKGHFSQLCCSKQHGRSPAPNVRTQNNNNRHSRRNVHEIDHSQFDDAGQFEEDSVTIQFKTQLRHKNIMFDEISTTPSLQRVLSISSKVPSILQYSIQVKDFFHVPLDAESKVLTAMLTPFGIYVYNVLAMDSVMQQTSLKHAYGRYSKG